MTGRLGVQAVGLVLLGLWLGPRAANAHYQFIHYTTRSAPYAIAAEKFDLSAIPGGKLYFFVPASGPAKMAPGDSVAAILSQIRLAAKTWSDVETSALRIEFGGFTAPDAVPSTPGVDVVFEELPPGVIAFGGPTARSALVSSDSGPFVPITRSVLNLGSDLSHRPSYSDDFFLTVVHELGHALGLQHTLTSGAMSTEVTRSTTRSAPLTADDVAGISLLYPSASFAAQTGSISGRVTLNGQGVHLASVVALPTTGSAVSALTDPDGHYSITGLPPGQYYLYVHPLPPGVQSGLGPADLVLPVDPDGKPVPAGPLFETTFYPGTNTVPQATNIAVQAGQALAGFDFAVGPRSSLDVYGVATYSFPGSYTVKPAFINVNNPLRRFAALSGVGLVTGNAPTPGLKASVVGGSIAVLDDGIKAYAPAPSFLELDFSFTPFGGEGSRHLVFSLNDDIYVLPGGVHVVRSQPPAVASVTASVDAQGNPVAIVAGSNLVQSTRILFDGWPAPVVSMDESNGSLLVLPPPGASNYRATVTALDEDGQDSLFLNPSTPPSYTYAPASSPSVIVSPAALPAGSEAMIEITGANTNFTEGYTEAGFGTSDVVVRKVWVVSPGRLLANVRLAEGAQQTAVPLTVISGFQIATQAAAMQVGPPRSDVPVMNSTLINPLTNQPSIYAGGQAALTVTQLPAGLTTEAVGITLDNLDAKILSVEPSRIVFEVPAGLSVGPSVLRLSVAQKPVQPIVVAIDPAPPVIQTVSVYGTFPVGAQQPVTAGQDVWVTVTGLDAAAVANPGLVRVNLGEVVHTASSVTPSDTDPNSYVVMFTAPAGVAGSSVPLTIAIGYRVSQPVAVPVQAAR